VSAPVTRQSAPPERTQWWPPATTGEYSRSRVRVRDCVLGSAPCLFSVHGALAARDGHGLVHPRPAMHHRHQRLRHLARLRVLDDIPSVYDSAGALAQNQSICGRNPRSFRSFPASPVPAPAVRSSAAWRSERIPLSRWPPHRRAAPAPPGYPAAGRTANCFSSTAPAALWSPRWRP
jgi:hypothetical protein